jgi:hypothetical protein
MGYSKIRCTQYPEMNNSGVRAYSIGFQGINGGLFKFLRIVSELQINR